MSTDYRLFSEQHSLRAWREDRNYERRISDSISTRGCILCITIYQKKQKSIAVRMLINVYVAQSEHKQHFVTRCNSMRYSASIILFLGALTPCRCFVVSLCPPCMYWEGTAISVSYTLLSGNILEEGGKNEGGYELTWRGQICPSFHHLMPGPKDQLTSQHWRKKKTKGRKLKLFSLFGFLLFKYGV